MKTFVSATFALFLSCASVRAQATAQIHGTVKDASGAAVPGADVKATQTETNTVRAAISGADGSYVLTNLPLGPYQLEASKEGFTKTVQSGIVLQVNSDVAADVALKVGALTEQISVEASAALVETRSTGVGAVIENQRILELPLNGRTTTDLITMAGASVSYGVSQTRWFSYLPNISMAGGLFYGTDYSLDGASHLNFLSGTTMPIAFPDAVQEFKAESSGQTAQHGAASSVSVVTKSGTNEFHGDLFEFIRNDGFGSAREYFSTTTGSLKRHQFGGTAGGPIIKNRVFFFGGYQGTTIRANATGTQMTIPTQQMLNGDWTTFASAPCNQGSAKTLNAPFGGNQISPLLYSAPAMYIVNKYLPTIQATPNSCGRITYAANPTHENDGQYVGKVDYQLSDKQSVFVRSLDSSILTPRAGTLSSNLLNSAVGMDQLAQSYAIGDTYVVSPTMVQAFRLAFNRTANTLNGDHLFNLCDAGVKMWCGGTPGQLAGGTITGGFAFGSGLGDGDYWNFLSFAINDDISWIRGAHQMNFGVGAYQGRVDENNHFASPGTLIFNGTATGLGMADFFTGRLFSLFQGLPNTYDSRQNNVNLYFTDTWKVTQKLTLNFGVRWEPFLPLQVTNGQISNFSMDRFTNGTRSTVFVNAPLGFYFPGDPGFPEQSGAYRQWRHFDPRGGFAWDPKGDGKMSLRASYAFGYSYIPGIGREDQGGSNPWGGRSTYTNPASFSDPFANIPGGNPFPYTIDKNVIFTPRGQYITSPYDLPTPTTYSWNVSVQRQFGASWITSISYIGSRVQHMYVNEAINPALVLPGCITTAAGTNPCVTATSGPLQVDNRRLLSQLNPSQGQFVGPMDQWDPVATQRYNGLLLSAQKRLSRGISMSTNWTWSHCTGYMLGFNSKQDQTNTVPGNPLFDKGNCDADRRHIVNFTMVVQTPKFSNNLVRTVATGWQLAGLYKFTTGAPISVQDGQDRELTGINHQRPNLVPGVPVYGSDGPGGQYLNPKAFALAPYGTFGNLGWNSLFTPTYWDLDMALSRQFHITERQAIELRADAFNLSNSFVSNLQSTATSGSAAPQSIPQFATLTSNLFGQIIGGTSGLLPGTTYGAQSTRKIQFALKYTF